jgi:hypothetical protein
MLASCPNSNERMQVQLNYFRLCFVPFRDNPEEQNTHDWTLQLLILNSGRPPQLRHAVLNS